MAVCVRAAYHCGRAWTAAGHQWLGRRLAAVLTWLPGCTVRCALCQVGYETIESSEDAVLRQDMPPALKRVSEASHLLLDAAHMLNDDPFSMPARKKLIDGSRGWLALVG